jgi:hypothetical protein
MDPDLLALLKDLGVPIAVLLFILWLFLRGRLHSDLEYQEMKAQRDYYRRQQLTSGPTFPILRTWRTSLTKPGIEALFHDMGEDQKNHIQTTRRDAGTQGGMGPGSPVRRAGSDRRNRHEGDHGLRRQPSVAEALPPTVP